jgi:hypothetical protein
VFTFALPALAFLPAFIRLLGTVSMATCAPSHGPLSHELLSLPLSPCCFLACQPGLGAAHLYAAWDPSSCVTLH